MTAPPSMSAKAVKLAERFTGAYDRLHSKRFLEPLDRISEILFGLIIVLTFTCSFGFRQVEQGEVHTMLIEVIGCSLAWGVIDAVFYMLGCLAESGHNLLLLRQVRRTSDPGEARQIIASVMPPLIASRLPSDQYESLHQELRQLPEPPTRPPLTRRNLLGALSVFLAAFGSIFPVAIPFTFMSDARLALRVSNGIAIALLFLAGYGLGRYSSNHPWRWGVAMVVLGFAMVGVAIALGG
jgi:hypothetical protein